MQIRPPSRAWVPVLAAAFLGFAVAGQSAPAPAAPAKAATNAPPVEPAVTLSVFVNPPTPQDGRDPFFPLSTRHRPVVYQAKDVPVVAIAELELKGVSGSVGRRLAIINNRTFEVGEEGTVLSNVGRVRLTCKEINSDSVRVVLNGAERTLTLRPPPAATKAPQP
jgi:hypothetical protein